MSKSSVFFLIFFVIVVSILIVIFGYFFGDELVEPVDLPPTRTGKVDTNNIETDDEVSSERESGIDIVARNLEIPWEVAFLPDENILVTQRTGSIKKITETGQTYQLEGVEHVGEGGLLGMALHPDFASNQQIYVYMTTRVANGLENRVVKYRLEEDRLVDQEVILDKIPGARNHDGGRLAFGPDGHLYITTGDAGQPELSQDTNSLAGKILRIKDDGSIPEDNPFNNEVYSYGHRNPQGLAWDDNGLLWATEHGSSAYDELNLIEKGNNYGWPDIRGDESKSGMESPIAHSGADTWAPGGAIYWQDSIIFAGLRGTSLFRVFLDETKVTDIQSYFEDQFGRIRTVTLGLDNNFYITTSNTDGRGNVGEGDDMIIRIDPSEIN